MRRQFPGAGFSGGPGVENGQNGDSGTDDLDIFGEFAVM